MSRAELADPLDVRQAAAAAGRTAETIRRWIWSGRLPAEKIGNRFLISRADLSRAVKDGTGRHATLAGWLGELEEVRSHWSAAEHMTAADLVLDDRRRRSAELVARARR